MLTYSILPNCSPVAEREPADRCPQDGETATNGRQMFDGFECNQRIVKGNTLVLSTSRRIAKRCCSLLKIPNCALVESRCAKIAHRRRFRAQLYPQYEAEKSAGSFRG